MALYDQIWSLNLPGQRRCDWLFVQLDEGCLDFIVQDQKCKEKCWADLHQPHRKQIKYT